MPTYVVRTLDCVSKRELPAVVVEEPDGAAAGDAVAAPDIRVTLVEAYKPEMGSLPTWSEVLAQHQQSRTQPARSGGGAVRGLVIAWMWLLSVVLGAEQLCSAALLPG